MFSVFNRIELLCAGLVLTGILTTLALDKNEGNRRIAIIFSIVLMAVVLIDTYGLTPHMSALGMQLNLLDSGVVEVPAAMNQMHAGYWVLEMLKLAAGTIVLGTLLKNKDLVAE